VAVDVERGELERLDPSCVLPSRIERPSTGDGPAGLIELVAQVVGSSAGGVESEEIGFGWKVSVASIPPLGPPLCTMPPAMPRRRQDACWINIGDAPAHSPPTAIPCTRRMPTKTTAAAAPIWVEERIRPIPTDAAARGPRPWNRARSQRTRALIPDISMSGM
jgi:hypothetical protein